RCPDLSLRRRLRVWPFLLRPYRPLALPGLRPISAANPDDGSRRRSGRWPSPAIHHRRSRGRPHRNEPGGAVQRLQCPGRHSRGADGRDISWIWDADFEVAAGKFAATIVSGTRAEEMALRLKYAGWDENGLIIERDLKPALEKALGLTSPGSRLSVIPTYTAM